MQIKEFIFNGHNATVVIPDDPNGEWIWKTEFFHAFEKSELALSEMGYTRVYYGISDTYGSYEAVRLMHKFCLHVIKEFNLRDKAHLFGFSRGGLYAFNFALFYPENAASLYLDAPVLDLYSWPQKGSKEYAQMCREFCLSDEMVKGFSGSPLQNLPEFFANDIPLLVVAGDSDEIVPLEENSAILLSYCEENGIKVESVIKKGCGHHPHSLDDVSVICDFVKANSLEK